MFKETMSPGQIRVSEEVIDEGMLEFTAIVTNCETQLVMLQFPFALAKKVSVFVIETFEKIPFGEVAIGVPEQLPENNSH